MAESFEKVLAEAKQLSPEERQELVRELSKPEPPRTDDPPRTLYDALNARGLIGFMTDAPSDLSTNPIYMEGFGKDG
jgi:hypothetical protein